MPPRENPKLPSKTSKKSLANEWTFNEQDKVPRNNVSFILIQRNVPPFRGHKTPKHPQQITQVAVVSGMLLYKQSVAEQGRNIVYMKME